MRICWFVIPIESWHHVLAVERSTKDCVFGYVWGAQTDILPTQKQLEY